MQAYTNECLEQVVSVVAKMMDNTAVPENDRTYLGSGTGNCQGSVRNLEEGKSNQSKSSNPQIVVNNQSQSSGPRSLFVENTPTNATISNNGHAEKMSHVTINGSTTDHTTKHQTIGLMETFLQALEAWQQVAREMDSLDLNEKADPLQEQYVLEGPHASMPDRNYKYPQHQFYSVITITRAKEEAEKGEKISKAFVCNFAIDRYGNFLQ